MGRAGHGHFRCASCGAMHRIGPNGADLLRLRGPVLMLSFDEEPDSSEVPTIRRVEARARPPLPRPLPPPLPQPPPLLRPVEAEPAMLVAKGSRHVPMWAMVVLAAASALGAWWMNREPAPPLVTPPIANADPTPPPPAFTAAPPATVEVDLPDPPAARPLPARGVERPSAARASTLREPSTAAPATPLTDVAASPTTPPTEVAAPTPSPASEALAPLDRAALQASMGAAAAAAAACAQPGGPTGVGRVAVTVAPSGRVTVALVEGFPYAGTSVGACVARAFQGVTVPPFDGEYVKVRSRFTLR